MFTYETSARAIGFKRICGIDEAGRGPIAGPVVAAAVIFPADVSIPGVNDSKALSEAERERLYPLIFDAAISVGVGIVDPRTIDQLNILHATFVAMRKAVAELSTKPDYILVDGNMQIPGLPGSATQREIIKGDQKSFSIAAASIIAKVTRDRIMVNYAKEFPGYGFQNHKGYGTKDHYTYLQAFGPCPIHRLSCRGVDIQPNKKLQKHFLLLGKL